MYRKYAKIKRKYKSKRIFKPSYIMLMLALIMIIMAIGYSYWNTRLEVDGSVRSKTLPLDVDLVRTSEGRYSSNSDLTYRYLLFFTGKPWKIESEIYNGEDTLILNIKKDGNVVEDFFGTIGSAGGNIRIDLDLTLEIYNNKDFDFTDGNIEVVEIQDSRSIVSNHSFEITKNKDVLPAGDNATIKISGKLTAYRNTASATYKYKVTYKEQGIKHYFWYIINID